MPNQIQPHLLCKKGDVAPYVLLPGDPARVLRMAAMFDRYKEISYNREYRVVTGQYHGIPVSACSSGIGGPASAIAIEELNKIGAKVIVRVGSCGGNLKSIKIGDLIIADSVVRQDHTCLDYVPLAYPAVANSEVLSCIKESAKNLKANCHCGLTVSVDALYSPKTKEFKVFWREFGALAQDMEASTVLTLCRLRNIKAGVILLVVDQEGEKNVAGKIAKYSIQAKTNHGDLVKYEQKAIKVALDAVAAYHKNYG